MMNTKSETKAATKTAETKAVETTAEVKTAEKKPAKATPSEAKKAPAAKPAAEKKAAAPKKAAPAKKEAAPKAAPEKKGAAPKKAVARKEVKSSVVIEFAGKQIVAKDVLEAAKKAYESMNKGAVIETIEIYVKPEEHTAYYVVNGEGSDQYKVML